jgi:hypothetical protein
MVSPDIRLLTQRRVSDLLETTVERIMRRRRRVQTAAGDSSGFAATRASRYYVWRAKQRGKPKKSMTYRHFPKLGIICDASNHVILSAVPGIGPRPDVDELEKLLGGLTWHPTLERMVLDAGYDCKRPANPIFNFIDGHANMPPNTNGGMYGLARSKEGDVLAADGAGAGSQRALGACLVHQARSP